tara:strand:+ start:162 stop:386 length:225 start_codon:yes stop_codon:yes gene_type:complete
MSEDLSKILEKLEHMEEKINVLEKQTQKMSDHIDFIDSVYSKISSPLWWLCNKVNGLRLSSNEEDKRILAKSVS